MLLLAPTAFVLGLGAHVADGHFLEKTHLEHLASRAVRALDGHLTKLPHRVLLDVAWLLGPWALLVVVGFGAGGHGCQSFLVERARCNCEGT